MNADEIKRAASSLLPLPDGLDAAGQAYYTTMRNLYFAYHTERITLERAQKESVAARKQYDQWVLEKKLCTHTAKMWVKIEAASTKFVKEHTLEAADDFYRAVYGFPESWKPKHKTEENQ